MKVLLVGKLPPAMDAAIQALGVDIALAADMPAAAKLPPAKLASVVGVITSSEVPVQDEHLAAIPGLRFVGRAAAGTDNIDFHAAKKRRIKILSIPLATAPCAAELTMGHIVSLLRRVPYIQQKLRDGVWGKFILGEEVAGKTLGIVGLGRVGGRVARLAQAFGMKTLACDPYIARARFTEYACRPLPLPRLLELAQVVTLHTPLTAETRGFIGAPELARMRDGAWLINCARGGLVDETALLAALNAGRLTGAAIDTWVGEPTPRADLVNHERVLGSAHIGAATVQAKARLVTYMAREVQKFLSRSRSR